MRGNSLDSVEGVEVLVEGDLEDGRATLSGSDGRRGEEVRPDSEPSLGEVNGTEDNNGTEERKGRVGRVPECDRQLIIILYEEYTQVSKANQEQKTTHRSPYLAMTLSLFLSQFWYHRRIVAE